MCAFCGVAPDVSNQSRTFVILKVPPDSEVLFDFKEGSSRIFEDPSDLLPGSRRVTLKGGGITRPVNTVLGEFDLQNTL